MPNMAFELPKQVMLLYSGMWINKTLIELPNIWNNGVNFGEVLKDMLS